LVISNNVWLKTADSNIVLFISHFS